MIVAVISMWAIARFMQLKDEVLDGVKEFINATPVVTELSGENPEIIVHKSTFYDGVPGKDLPYREYVITAKGLRGKADFTVRAIKLEAQSAWSYQLRAFN